MVGTATTTIGGVTFRNGQIPTAVLALADTAGHRLQPATATALRNMSAAMQAAGLGALTLTSGHSAYRSLADQAYMIRIGLTTIPAGQSEHGLALAVDLYKIGGFHTARYLWLAANAYRYGFSHPYWAREGGPLPEFWHWQHDGKTTGPVPAPTPPPVAVPAPTPIPSGPEEDDMLTLILWCYTELVGRTPTVGEVANQINLTAGKNSAQVLGGFLGAPPERASVIRAYRDILGRTVDPSDAEINQRLGWHNTIGDLRDALTAAYATGAR